MNETPKNREWVKNAAIVFLAVLLVLTFFSNTIMNRSLPEVATQEVNTGDVLFVLGEGDATELEQAKETLRNLQTSYQRTALSTPIYNYSAQERAIQNAHTAYDRAAAKLAEAQSKRDSTIKDPVTTAAKERYEAAKAEAERLEKEYTEQRDARIEELKSEIAEKQQQKAAMEASAQSLKDAYDQALAELESAQSDLSYWESEKQRAEEVFNAVNGNESATEEEKRTATEEYTAAINSHAAASQAVPAAEAKLSSASEAYYAALGSDYDALSSAISSLEAEKASLENDTVHYEAVRAAIKLRDQLYDEYAAMAGYVEEDYQTALYALQDADAALQAAYDNLYTAQENDARSAATAGVELSSIQEEIRLQQEKIKSLAGDEENVITANVSGTVDTVDCTAGDTVLKDALLCTIEVPDMGHTLSVAVTNDQAQRLRVGDTATISNYYWGNSITATLTSIRTDPKKAQTNKLLTFDLTGDVTTGAELTISVGQKSATYDLIVPNSAIKSDTNGRFVLAVTAKSSPLGNRYTARRVSVEVLANDDNNSAIVADLSSGDYVITTSSAPLNSGDMVRMADS